MAAKPRNPPLERQNRRPARLALHLPFRCRPINRELHRAMFQKSRQLVGVDIGSTAIKAIELTQAGRHHSVRAFGTEPVPGGAVVDGTINDVAAVADAMRRLFERHRIRTPDVAASLSGSGVFVKRITVPMMSELELAASIGWEVEQHIPLDVEELHFDYERVSDSARTGGAMEILLAAATKEKVARHVDAITKAGKTPAILDVTAFALQNAYEVNHEIEPNGLIALIDVGTGSITVHVVRDGRMLFTRDSAAGNDVVGETIAAIDAFGRTLGSMPLDRIVTTGGASKSPALVDALATRFGVRVEPLDPFRRIAFDPERLDLDAASVAATAAVAVGLALRRRNDR